MTSKLFKQAKDAKIEKFEQDWKVLFGALAAQVMAAYHIEMDEERAGEHLEKAVRIIENAYSAPFFISTPDGEL